ncbi:hypothetical protein CABS01_13534 [Colletotrichum abscissum]|uniref:Uncharacterized protein n=1 Tax=Colletotrichum abscissum TaxID=1671311 RepID=A0A9P9X674_9PEZI|nr:uncharacterized protein CABS01_13534 [Colletotrichum abscissum]KAI3539123.1 hypothetical protein CABS02_11544 [Colletotrichum abscissum]KAK1485840.1 hypothetical protein CABS01_13534 [Colletotrichum abscissum]
MVIDPTPIPTSTSVSHEEAPRMCIFRYTGSQMARRGTVEARERKPSRAKQAYAAPEFISPQCLPLLVPGTHRSHLTDRYSVSVQSADQRDIWGIVIDKAWRHPQSMVPLLDADRSPVPRWFGSHSTMIVRTPPVMTVTVTVTPTTTDGCSAPSSMFNPILEYDPAQRIGQTYYKPSLVGDGPSASKCLRPPAPV